MKSNQPMFRFRRSSLRIFKGKTSVAKGVNILLGKKGFHPGEKDYTSKLGSKGGDIPIVCDETLD